MLAQSDTLTEQAITLYKQGHYADAEPPLREALAIQEKTFGPDDPEILPSLNNLAGIYREQGHYAKAELLYRRALAIGEKQLGRNNPALALSLNNLAALFSNEGRYGDAEPLFRRALALKEKESGPDDPDVARTLNNLAQLYRLEGLHGQAEPLCKRSLAILKKVLGPDHPDVATSLNNLGQLYWAQGRYNEAEPLLLEALTMREKAFGSEHPIVAGSLNNLAELYRSEDRFGEAEPLYRQALAIREQAFGPEHPDVATTLQNMAALDEVQGHYAEAEALCRRALTIREKALGSEHPDVAASLDRLATLYQAESRSGDAEPLYLRALAIREKTFAPANPDISETIDHLAFLYDALGRYGEAEPLFRRSLAIAEKTLGPENPDLAAALNNLAVTLSHQSRYPEAEGLYRRALALQEKALGPDHPNIARSLTNLAVISRAQGHNNLAEPLYRRALNIREKALGPDHPLVAVSLNNLAEVLRAEGRIEAALAVSSRSVDILEKQLATDMFQTGGLAERRRDRAVFGNYVRLAYAAAKQSSPSGSAVQDTFRAAQLAQAWQTAPATAAIVARLADGADGVAALAREGRELAGRRQQLEADILEVASRPPARRDPAREEALRAALDANSQRVEVLGARIAREFPAYAGLISRQPLSLDTARNLLGNDEVLLVYFSTADETWLWAVRHDRAALFPLGIGVGAIANEVSALRARLDPMTNPTLEPYPASRGYRLYEKILAAAAQQLDGANRLLIVADGPLQSLPPGVLVTKPTKAEPQALEDYRDIDWLARDYAVAVLPAVSTLRVLRETSASKVAVAGFLGVGGPLLGEGTRGVRLANLGMLGDADAPGKLRTSTETVSELRAVAHLLGASDDDLLLGERASEQVLRRMPLETYRVIEFAAPALVSGGLEGMPEPALMLSPSIGDEAEDKGLLTASKIAGLKLNADWVVLSGCNTAGADGSPRADGLSVLANAFFYAGARGLVVSHWRAAAPAAVRLTGDMIAELAKAPAIGRAEALRRAISGMLAASSPPELAHPAAWGTFVHAGGD